MPAGVRLQQLTPVMRGATTQPTTIVRLMSPATSSVRPGGTGHQQIIQLNTNKQQQPLVIKAITAQTTNRPQMQQQQQSIVLTTNSQQKSIVQQGQQQVLVLNQNAFTNAGGQQAKFTIQMTNAEPMSVTAATPPSNTDAALQLPSIPQLDGSVDDQVQELLDYISEC